MTSKRLGLYFLLISLIPNSFSLAVADEIDDSLIYRLPANTNNLSSENSAKQLMSDFAVEGEASSQNNKAVTSGENRVVKYSVSPLEVNSLEPATMESAITLPSGTLDVSSGFIVYPTGSVSSGIGLQVYYASLKYGITDNLQISLDTSYFDDVLGDKFNGKATELTFFSLAPNVKYKFIEEPSYSFAIVGSLEWLQVLSENGLFSQQGTSARQQDDVPAGTIQLPVTYNFTENSQWHLVTGVAIFPDNINGGDFYGTFFNVGTGVSIKIGERFGILADVNVPIKASGGNSVSQSGKIRERLVWSAGINYLHSPNLALDFAVTNRLGTTPATKLLTFLPDGDEIGAVFKLRYIPDIGQNYRGHFGKNPFPPMNYREKQLLFDGIILSSPTTLRKGMFLFDGGIASSTGNLQIGYGLSDTAQIEFLAQQLADNNQPLNDNLKLGVATKLTFLNQAQGDPISLGGRIAVLSQKGTDSFSGELSLVYSFNDVIAFTFNPKVALFGDEDIIGTGVGFNLQLFPGFQLIGEVTPMVSDDPTVWAAGARYLFPGSNVGLGVYGTNAAGTSDIGSFIRQSNDDVSVGVNLMWLLGGQSAEQQGD